MRNCCSDVMTPVKATSCCTPSDTATHAAKAMRSSGGGCAPVVEDVESFKLVGVVTERDVCCGTVAEDHDPSKVRAADIMRPATACCGVDEPIEAARRKLHEHRATSLPVVDKAGGCCGTVGMHDLERM
jgi:CBS domain-containing protein